MINRLFKTIFILAICFCISIQTNAAVSVSDGSAFVTKTEFDSDLNNLSNRMAQLENSLDAKIDSLVSSYLTRNGIWNGAKQTTQNYTIKYKDLLPIIRTTVATVGGKLSTTACSSPLFSWVSIPSCDKTGMLVMNTRCNHSWNYDFSSSDNYKHSLWQANWSGYIQIDKKVSTGVYEMLGTTTGAISALPEYYMIDNTYFSVSVPSTIFNTKVFVSKDDEIVSRLVLTCAGRVTGVTTFPNSVQYVNSCFIDTTEVTSSTHAANNTDITWMCDAQIY